MKFKITYTSGLVEEVEQSDADSIDGFINTKFGIDAAAVAETGTTIELLDASNEAVAVVEVPAEEQAPAEETPAV
jgi:hypothetical protein